MDLFITILAVILVFIASPASAAGDDVSVSVAAMSWYNRYVPISRIGGMDVPKSSFALMYGPALTARYRDLSLDVSYLLTADNYQLVITDNPVRVHRAHANSSASRSDIDLVVGYRVTPDVRMNAGYKGIFVDDSLSLVSLGSTQYAKRRETYHLGTLGAGTAIPLGTGTVWSLNGSALLGVYHNEVSYPPYYNRLNEPADDTAAWGISADTTVSFLLFDGLSTNVGLKYQFTKAGCDNSNFFGPTLSFEYRF